MLKQSGNPETPGFSKLTLITLLFLISSSTLHAQELSIAKMKDVTEDVLELFVNNNPDERLRNYISNEWLEDKKINLSKYSINYYVPEEYKILTASGNICVAVISGKSWKHLIIFKFTEERSTYRLIPKGISKVTGEYIDPWWEVYEYICDSGKDK